jgi:hypothetical protein
MAKQFSTKLIYHRCVYLSLFNWIYIYIYYIHIHAFYSFSAWITSSVFLFSKISSSSSSSISFSFSSFLFYLIKSIGLVCILVNIYPLGLTCYFFVSISCDASIVVTTSLFVTNPLISEATVVIKCTTYRTNTVDIPPDQKTSHTLFVRYSIPLQISDLTNNTQIHTFFIRIKFLSIFLHLFTLNSFYEISNNRCSLASFSFFLA